MFLVSFRLRDKRVWLSVFAAVLVLAGGVFGVHTMINSALAPVSADGQSGTVKIQKVKAKTNEDRIAFLESYGWTVDSEPIETTEVTLPAEFDQVYVAYNALQKAQGFQLEKYAGKQCTRYTYRITNYPQADCEVQANLLMCGNRIIGGDICSAEADGFLCGFDAPTETTDS